MEERLLTREEVEYLNAGKEPTLQYLAGTLEWREGYDYIFVPGTGSWVHVVKREEDGN